ncbi:hypothetical protein [Roseateles violae]|uniref:Glycoside hydrolase family 38 central domain-containing protein n=1 Tax=Roseateles violae TaxID=3058042 RepID=A0ABT8DQP3_9BURK|nr:hypothetical protein [Pelomonas sp. PFR6]MDN3920331.1 hypothetical protein [Pelomonas sp. PFR6]
MGVVVQTHWDREWYFTREQFVARLLRVMARVADQLERGDLQQFLFDGQVAALEDLLAHGEPDLCERVLRLVREGRIVLGPWYVMADEFLCSGESLWRNLEIGMADARAHGNCQTVGYLPDSFGHIAQMPQIFRHHGIESSVLWRGVDTPHSEFDWVAPDGSTVGTLFLTQGYYQHPFNVEDWRGALNRYLEQIAPRALSENLLLTQGGDHLLPHAELAARIVAFNAEQVEYELVQEGLQQHAERVLAATAGRRPRVQGELRANAQAFVLPDVLSTRRYLKLAQQLAEDRLLGEIEPLFAMLDVPLPERALDQCWRSLLQQQAHDSICGCSADAVHREMVSRFEQLQQRLDALRQQALLAAGMVSDEVARKPGPFADDAAFTLFNPLPQPREGWQTLTLFLAGEAATGLRVLDEQGQALPASLLSVTPARQFHSPLDDFPDPVIGHDYEVALLCPLGGLQARKLRLEKAEGVKQQVLKGIANAHYRIALDAEGELQIHAGGRLQPLWLASELDAGDSYNYAPPPQPERRRHTRFTPIGVRRCGDTQEMLLAISARLPASLDAQRQGPSGQDVECRGTLRLRLHGDSRFIDAQLDWDNQAQDQRTRLVLPLNEKIAESWSDSAFVWQRRPLVLADYPAELSRREMPVAVNPSYSAIAAGPVQLAHRAMQEYEILAADGEQQALAVTLVRSVGWLSRRDLVTRGVGAGPDIATPEAQCLGEQRFEFRLGLLGMAGDQGGDIELLTEAQALRRPPLALRGHGDKWRAPHQLDNRALQVSALRRRAGALELRVWNPTDETQGDVPPCGIASYTL